MADTGRRAPLATRNDISSESQADETRMRRALGLGTGGGHSTPQQRPEQARARHRFVQDGGVPVVMLNAKAEPETAALRERITALEAKLEAERAAHAATRRQLEAEHHAATALQTRIAHNELAHKDALEQERRLRESAQLALQEALTHGPARRARPAPVTETLADASEDDDRLHALDLGPAEPSPGPQQERRPRGRPRLSAAAEPKPVRWWTPSYRTKKP